ncbi:MAG: hypothetical protein M1308_16595 [Actinobacteria bacterium]|nr:hypothetical protein [Actinomycetota bacterium]
MKMIFKNKIAHIVEIKGSIAVIVLVIAVVVILAVSTMGAFMIKDIGFTQMNEQKLRALNIAEAGISNMFLNIVKYKNNETSSLPSSPYTGNVITNGIEEGTYEVSFTIPQSSPEDIFPIYIIESLGTDKNGQKRTVRVSIIIVSQYNFIFSFNSLNGDGRTESQTAIIGAYATNGDIDLAGTGGYISYFVGSPLLINGNILNAGGNSTIGELNFPVDLYLGGTCDEPLTSGYVSKNIFLKNFYNQKFDLTQLVVDDNYINNIKQNGAATVNGDLTITNSSISPVPSNQNLENYIKFENNILKISGNIVVEGSINFNNNNKIYYEGKGNLISTVSINLSSGLVPNNLSSITFPSGNLIVLTSKNNINFKLGNSSGGVFNNPDCALVGICNNIITIPNNKYIRIMKQARFRPALIPEML